MQRWIILAFMAVPSCLCVRSLEVYPRSRLRDARSTEPPEGGRCDPPVERRRRPCTVLEAFRSGRQRFGKDAFIERICGFVRHANARSGPLP